jgi:acetylglutamate kinase
MPIVIKYGGNAMTNASVRRAVAAEIGLLAAEGLAPVVVHGGGPFIEAALAAAGISSSFVRGLRVTPPEAIATVERALTLLNKELAQQVGNAVGLTGRDASVLRAVTFDPDLGRVGRMRGVNDGLLKHLLAGGFTPVLACLAVDEASGAEVSGGVLNVNADEVAGAVAGALSCPAVFLTNVVGVLDDPADPASLLPELSHAEMTARVADGRIAGGMIPKVEGAMRALEQGAAYAIIADGRDAAALRQAVLGRAGTRVRA